MNIELDPTASFLLLIIGLFFFAMILFSSVMRLNRFSQELSRINMEIRRTVGLEKKYWQQRKKRLWLALLLFRKF